MLERAAEEGARRALCDVGLGKDAVLTIHDMRSLLDCPQLRPEHRRASQPGADCAAYRHRNEAQVVRAEPLIRPCPVAAPDGREQSGATISRQADAGMSLGTEPAAPRII